MQDNELKPLEICQTNWAADFIKALFDIRRPFWEIWFRWTVFCNVLIIPPLALTLLEKIERHLAKMAALCK